MLVDANSNTPTNEEVGCLLKEFTLSFMHGGFSELVSDIMSLILKGHPFHVDKSVFFWILSYFLHLATTINIKFDHISGVIGFDIVSYLVYECINACEKMELHLNENESLSQYIGIYLNLTLTALKEVVSTIDLYSKKCTGQKDKMMFNELCGKLADLHDLRNLPFLLFHIYPKTSSLQFLEDVIVYNHHTLNIVIRASEYCWQQTKMNILSHLKMFSNVKIVSSYAKILQNFNTNSHFLNECVFTMMHHLAGDLNSADLLFEPSILKTFSDILEKDTELDQYQEDLIMYIMNKFAFKVEQNTLKFKKFEESGSIDMCNDSSSDTSVCCNVLCKEVDDLFWWYLQFEQDSDPIARISEYMPMVKEDILMKLQLKGFISQETYNNLEEKMLSTDKQKIESQHIDELKINSQISNFNQEITKTLRCLVQSGERQHLLWIQDVLLEMCYNKLNQITYPPEPVCFYSIKMMQSVPFVPYTEEQRRILKNEIFIELLQKLGFQLGPESFHIFPRIPIFWTADVIFAIAARLGPINKNTLKFCYEDLQIISSYDISTDNNFEHSLLPPMSSCCTLSSWLCAVEQHKKKHELVYDKM